MKRSIRIAIIGDYEAHRLRQTATIAGLNHSAKKMGIKLETIWFSTTQLGTKTEELLCDFDAYFGAPGAVASLDGALRGIRFARESNKPFLGTCAGFQYAVLEFARNVMGIQNATSAEFDPNSSQLVLSELTCQIVGKKMKVRIMPNTLAHKVYGTVEVMEEHHCRYGINSKFSSALQCEEMHVSATDEKGEPRIIELPRKRFYLATLFVPQTSSTFADPHPLLVVYLKAALN